MIGSLNALIEIIIQNLSVITSLPQNNAQKKSESTCYPLELTNRFDLLSFIRLPP